MLHTVEVCLVDRDLGTVMAQMRDWLDNRRFEPDVFRFAEAGSKTTIVSVGFKIESEATAFAETFHGRITGAPGVFISFESMVSPDDTDALAYQSPADR